MQLLSVTTAAVEYLKRINRRTLDVLASRIYFYYSLAHEKQDTLDTIRRCASPANSRGHLLDPGVCLDGRGSVPVGVMMTHSNCSAQH